MRATMWLLVGLTLAQPALAGNEQEVAAETKRLKEQLRAYTERTAWPGVERVFQQIEALEDPPITLDDWFLGAQAARALGDATSCQRRLLAGFFQAERGLTDGQSMDPMAFQWLGELDTTYGLVRIKAKVDGTLEPVVPPFESDRRAAIAFVDARLDEVGEFEGLLPIGEYTYGNHTFTVRQGTSKPQKVKLK